ncbi:ELWxxDGT repeat protein [Corallococcus sp. 4LFB]|uniref:ELWxxDGT repeat protein n=1 Tax=Corallococcus sp. 4LFB TaxID=3383249 RepID=UPI00397625EE
MHDGVAYFAADDGTTGVELWRTDGTTAGTRRVKDLWPGPLGSSPQAFIELEGRLYFMAVEEATGFDLWRTDGTAAGTVALDLMPGQESLLFSDAVAVGGLFIFHQYSELGDEPWRTDATPEGTFLLADVYPGSNSSFPTDLTVVGRRVFFVAENPEVGRELWVTDGTRDGTVLVKDITPGAVMDPPQYLAAFDGRLFFSAQDGGATGRELWVSNGTAAGTRLFKDLAPGPPAGRLRGSSPWPARCCSPRMTAAPDRSCGGAMARAAERASSRSWRQD